MTVPDPVALGLLVVAVVAMPYLAVRGYRMAIICTPATVTVRGWLRSRTMSIEDVVDAGDLLSGRLLRLDANGRVRTTPVIAFVTIVTAFSRTKEHNLLARQRLRDWIVRHQSGSARRRNTAALRRRPVRRRLLWLGGSFDDVIGWVFIAVMLICGGLLVEGLPAEIRAAQGQGRPGTFTAAELDCDRAICSWNGAFRSHDGTEIKGEAWLYGTHADDMQAGDQVEALDTGHAHKVFTPGTHDLISCSIALIVMVILGWYGFWRLRGARRKRLAELRAYGGRSRR
ncbi:hypothetical protein ACFWY5_49185 [Nonomuraea sp. NPDC059007]|uniref:hypothetical protein n=1 Tax=Nonomuraea sp. NPDC059007 TaxID=3346692 RepID=UPI0036BBE4E4